MKKSTQFPALKLKHWPFWSCSRRNRSSLMLGVRSFTATISAGTCSSALPPWWRHCQRSVSARKRWGRSRIEVDEISGSVNLLIAFFLKVEFLNWYLFLLQDFSWIKMKSLLPRFMVLVFLIAGFQKGQFDVVNETSFLILCFFRCSKSS